jgi:hypothetical protein
MLMRFDVASTVRRDPAMSDQFRAHAVTARRVAIATAWIAAMLYALIGLGVLEIGESTNGGTTDLFAFGAMMAAIFAITAVLLMRFRSSALWVAVAVLQLFVLIGYVAVAGYRLPAFELWGLLVKVDQAILLAASLYLVIRGRSRTMEHAS